jgi:tetratricopeptide (TPR) repeat protein
VHSVSKLLISIAIATSVMPALADDFPGTGNRADWSAALPYYNLGNDYLKQDRYQDAAAKFQEAVSRYQFDPDFYTNLGFAYRKLEDYPNAEAAFKRATELTPNDWMPWSDLANVYLKQNRLPETISTFRRTLKCNPPASEKTAIEQDIADITKIMKMQAGDQPREDEVEKPEPKPSTNNAPRAVQRQLGRTSASHAKTLLKPDVPAPAGRLPASQKPPRSQPLPNQAGQVNKSGEQLKQSGWDYIYK